MVGVKYQTFASWIQKRRRARGQYPMASTVKALPSTATDALRLVEAVVERAGDQVAATAESRSLCVHLPGGARMEGRDARQAVLAAELLRALARHAHAEFLRAA